MGFWRGLALAASGLVFVVLAILSALFGRHALQSVLATDVERMIWCTTDICGQHLAEKILSKNQRQMDALGRMSIIYTKKMDWNHAEAFYDQYFAVGGKSSEVQKWYQKLLGHQASARQPSSTEN